MRELDKGLEKRFQESLAELNVSKQHQAFYKKWLRFYLDFCRKYDKLELDPQSLEAFMRKLAEKRQEAFKQKQAAEAIRVYWKVRERPAETKPGAGEESDLGWEAALNSLGNTIKTRQYSKNTLRTYVGWVREFSRFLAGRNVGEVDASHAAEFFTYLAVEKRVAASTQNQAFNALLFFFKNVLKKEFEGFEGVIRAKRSNYIPVVLSREEVDRVLARLYHPNDLMVSLLYGCGLRRFELVNLRVHSLNFDAGLLTVHDGKGKKDRTVPLPEKLVPSLRRQINRVTFQLDRDLADGFDGVFIEGAASRKYQSAAKQLPWQWVFPARNLTLVPETEELRRYHAHASKLGEAIRTAAHEAQMTKRVTAHTFRHSYASHLLQANYDIRTVQKLLGHGSVKTTMIYTHTVPSKTLKEPKSPLDF